MKFLAIFLVLFSYLLYFCTEIDADLKADFPSADFVGNNRYVFNIKGNNYRTVVLVVFFAGTVAIRFVGTHGEYDKIKDIKNI